MYAATKNNDLINNHVQYVIAIISVLLQVNSSILYFMETSFKVHGLNYRQFCKSVALTINNNFIIFNQT